ncbi:hypothetical protein [Streptomyces sp. NPDC002276]
MGPAHFERHPRQDAVEHGVSDDLCERDGERRGCVHARGSGQDGGSALEEALSGVTRLSGVRATTSQHSHQNTMARSSGPIACRTTGRTAGPGRRR